MLHPFIVVAARRRVDPHQPFGDPRKARPTSYLPQGVRHGVAPMSPADVPAQGDRRTGQALCGETVQGWYEFPDLAFTGAEGADCQRCEQELRRRRGGATPGDVEGVGDVGDVGD